MPTINTHGDGSEEVARCCDLYPDCLHVVQSGEQEAEARARLADQNPVAALLEENHRLVAALAKAEQELGDLRHNARILEEAREHESRRAFRAEQELAVYKEREARYERDRAELDRIDREAGDV